MSYVRHAGGGGGGGSTDLSDYLTTSDAEADYAPITGSTEYAPASGSAEYDASGAADDVAAASGGVVLGDSSGTFGSRPTGYALVFWVCQGSTDDPSSSQTVETGDVRIRPSA